MHTRLEIPVRKMPSSLTPLMVPKCNYQIGPFIIDKNYELTCDDKELSILELTIERLAENHDFHGLIEEFPEEKAQLEEEKHREENVGITVSVPLANGVVKSKTGDDTTDATYQNWYKAVYMPATELETRAAASTSNSGK